MFLAEKTVKNYVSSIFAKLGMHRRTQAAALITQLRADQPRGSSHEGYPRVGPVTDACGGSA